METENDLAIMDKDKIPRHRYAIMPHNLHLWQFSSWMWAPNSLHLEEFYFRSLRRWDGPPGANRGSCPREMIWCHLDVFGKLRPRLRIQ